MKALVYTGTEEVTFKNVSIPEPLKGESRIKIEAVGICGSDMHAYHGKDERRVPPLILGHEAAGVVVSGKNTGKHVVLNPLITCSTCKDCLSGRTNLCVNRKLIGMNYPGAFAEFINISEQNLIQLPEGMKFTHAALTEPAGTSFHALKLAEQALTLSLSDVNALVIGGGSIGLLAALFLKSRDCKDIFLCDTNPLRRETALLSGCCKVFDPQNEPPELDNNFELVIDAVGMEKSRTLAIRAVRPGGVMMHIGLQNGSGNCDFRKITLGEITVIGTYTYTHNDLEEALMKLSSGALGDLSWIEKRPLAEGASAFSDLNDSLSASPKIVLLPHA
tara:strand:+ start:82 stop:1080 length:999 start_codon:yes stop_codon:yes gene_type:complete